MRKRMKKSAVASCQPEAGRGFALRKRRRGKGEKKGDLSLYLFPL